MGVLGPVGRGLAVGLGDCVSDGVIDTTPGVSVGAAGLGLALGATQADANMNSPSTSRVTRNRFFLEFQNSDVCSMNRILSGNSGKSIIFLFRQQFQI